MEKPTREEERLASWKEIAAYLHVTVRTAQRWEKAERLPVRRHKHAALSSVFAYKVDLESWWHSRPNLQEPRAETPAPTRSIAVLPFVNLSRNEADEILGDGLTEELINALARIEGLQVIARTSVFHFKNKNADVRTVAARLGVSTVLEGSVRRAGERVRITAQLIDATDGCHLWSERYDRRPEDLLDLEEEIARAIADALRVKLTAPALISRNPRGPVTYELYLEGRFYLNKRTPVGLQRAIRCFEQVLARDRGMARAWAALAECYAMLPSLAGYASAESLAKAKAAALKALEIDSGRAEAHTSLAFIKAIYEYDWAGAEGHFRRALELDPDHGNSHMLYAGVVLAPTGRLERAGIHVARACELDPFSAAMVSALAMHFLSSGALDRAISTSRRALELDPRYPWAHRTLGEALLLEKKFDEAITAFANIDAQSFAGGYVGHCHARRGRLPEARRLLSELRDRGPSLAYQTAVLHLGLGDLDAMFDCLNQACAARSLGVHWLNSDPIWDDIRSDARFTAVLEKMGLVSPVCPGE